MIPASFNPQPVLEGETLLIRPLTKDDFAELHEAASDPATWAGHPAKERHREEVFQPYFEFLLNSGTTLAIIDRFTNTVIGCSRYYIGPDTPDDISIGFTFVSNQYWGGVTNREMKRLMLGHAYQSFGSVWFHIDPTNIRSQKATAKLGAIYVENAVLDLAGSPAEWMCYRLPKDIWEKVLAEN